MNLLYNNEYSRVLAEKNINEYIIDNLGNKWIDATSGGFAVTNGYGVREFKDAVVEVLESVGECHHFQHTHKYGKKLTDALSRHEIYRNFYSDVITVGSASDAMELALRITLKKHILEKSYCRIKFISRDKSYYGGTAGCLEIGDRDSYKNPFRHIYNDSIQFKAPVSGASEEDSIDDLLYQINKHGVENIAGIVLELIPSTSCGVYVPSVSYNKTIYDIALQYSIPLIVDDVVTNSGRIGYVSACDYYKVYPDIIVQGKGISNGITPTGAALFKNNFLDVFREENENISVSFTAMNNPINCNVWSSILNYILDNNVLEKVIKNEKIISNEISELKQRYRIDHIGYFMGIDVPASKYSDILKAFNDNKIFVFKGESQNKRFKNIVFAWPLCSDINNIKLTIDILKQYLLV